MLNKVQSGDPLKIPASTYNAFIDAARPSIRKLKAEVIVAIESLTAAALAAD
jgi:hypothetical protein